MGTRLKKRSLSCPTVFECLLVASAAPDLMPTQTATGCSHAKWRTESPDNIREFCAFVTCFPDADDEGDVIPDRWAIPHWVSYEGREHEGQSGKAPDRPIPWVKIDDLHAQWIEPKDESCHFAPDCRRRVCRLGVHKRCRSAFS